MPFARIYIIATADVPSALRLASQRLSCGLMRPMLKAQRTKHKGRCTQRRQTHRLREPNRACIHVVLLLAAGAASTGRGSSLQTQHAASPHFYHTSGSKPTRTVAVTVPVYLYLYTTQLRVGATRYAPVGPCLHPAPQLAAAHPVSSVAPISSDPGEPRPPSPSTTAASKRGSTHHEK